MDIQVEESNAIVCRGVCKTFGSSKSAYQVLRDVSITVPKGTIYALLGPSGCGKTTLLRCILGRLSINDGTISVYDEPPQNKNGPNRPKIGYMPQDIALAEELSGEETMQMFGKIAKMSNKRIKEKCKFLVKFLEMPFYKRELRRLSGGQKRRISFAVALIHEPDIIILDEPTVGVDPPLRKSIWEYLYKIAETRNTTIIVTTHYIEEAHMAHNVGLMLNGSMVAEDQPDALVAQHGCQNLEKVFLKLCLQRERVQSLDSNCEKTKEDRVPENDKIMYSASKSEEKFGEIERNSRSKKTYKYNWQLPSAQRVWALFLKDIWMVVRNPAYMLAIFGLPSVIMVLFAFCIGKPLRDLPLGVVNHDGMNFSTLYLQSIDANLIKQVHYDQYNRAFKDAKDGKLWGVLYMNSNFTKAITEKYAKALLAVDASLDDSLISVSLDLSNKNVEIIINLELLKSYRRFLHAVFEQLGYNTLSADMPVKFADRQVYGSIDTSFEDFLYPSFLLHMTFFITMSSTAVALIVAKESGNLDRLYISGAVFLEVAFGQILSQLFLMVTATTLSYITVFGIFRYSCAGSYILLFLLNVIQGFCGITIGIFISSVCDNQTMVIVNCIATFLLCSNINSFIWPMEGSVYILRIISLMLPQTYAFHAARSIVSRGWDLTHRTVVASFAISFAWSAVFIVLAMIAFRLKT